MQQAVAIIRDFSRQTWLELTDWIKIWRIHDHQKIKPALIEIENHAAAGYLVAGFMSYEAALAFDEALQTPKNTAFPLLWFAAFDPKKAMPVILDRTFNYNYKLKFKPSITAADYRKKFQTIKTFIKNGESYQVNFSFRMFTKLEYSPKNIFLNAIKNNPLPYGVYLETHDFAICSLSPELFLRLDGTKIESHPMKGTIKRGLSSASDKQQRLTLRSSAKEKAENTMILDMVRNDLGKIARIGSVKVTATGEIQKYPTAWQMISKVVAKTDADWFSILKALFPGASITGAPKKRTMEIIAQLESEPRKIYTGILGYLAPNRQAQFNIAIRSLLLDKKTNSAEYGTGSGIVWDSKNDQEYQECLLKAGWLNRKTRVKKFSLLETMLWAEGKYHYLSEHLKRLQDSANYWDIKCDITAIKKHLFALAKDFKTSACILRLTLSAQGALKTTFLATDYILLKANSFKNISLAERAVDPDNPFLYHKTTNRRLYQNLLKQAATADILMYNKKRQLTESTIANIALKIDGQFFTPPVSCGLLPGVLRQQLLKKGILIEKALPLKLLEKYDEIYLMNSVRGLHKVKIIS